MPIHFRQLAKPLGHLKNVAKSQVIDTKQLNLTWPLGHCQVAKCQGCRNDRLVTRAGGARPVPRCHFFRRLGTGVKCCKCLSHKSIGCALDPRCQMPRGIGAATKAQRQSQQGDWLLVLNQAATAQWPSAHCHNGSPAPGPFDRHPLALVRQRSRVSSPAGHVATLSCCRIIAHVDFAAFCARAAPLRRITRWNPSASETRPWP